MAEPTDAEIIREAFDSRLLDLHTSMPARVVVYNPLTQVVDAQPMIRRAIEKKDGSIAHEALPVVMNVPVMWLRGGGFSMRFPLNPGDTVWLMFSEVATAQWRSTGQLSNPGDLRRFDLSYACAIPAGYPATQPITTPVPPNTAHVQTPGDFVFGNPITAQYVALSTLVEARIAALKSAVLAALPTITDVTVTSGNAPAVAAVTAAPDTPVGAGTLKAAP